MKVIGLGAGGHAAVVIEILRADPAFELVGLLDPRGDLHGGDVLGVPVLGDDDLLAAQVAAGVEGAFVGLGSGSDMRPRRRLYELAEGAGLTVVDTVHPQASVSASAAVGAGVTLLARAVVGTRATLGNNVLVNTGAIVEHDCVVHDHVHIATSAALASGVVVEAGVHVGLGAVVNQGVTLGAGSVVGSGAVVVADVPPGVVVAGVPARVLRGVDD